jgi:hypothetical protein
MNSKIIIAYVILKIQKVLKSSKNKKDYISRYFEMKNLLSD